MVNLSLSIPMAFGKTALAEQIQTFVIEACAEAWDEGFYAASDGEFLPSDGENPYRKK